MEWMRPAPERSFRISPGRIILQGGFKKERGDAPYAIDNFEFSVRLEFQRRRFARLPPEESR